MTQNSRFSCDPSIGLYSISPEGEFELPIHWNLARKVLALDLTRRGGDPNQPAKEFSQDSNSQALLEHIQKQHPGEDVFSFAQTIKAKHDQQIEEFLKEYNSENSKKKVLKPMKTLNKIETSVDLTHLEKYRDLSGDRYDYSHPELQEIIIALHKEGRGTVEISKILGIANRVGIVKILKGKQTLRKRGKMQPEITQKILNLHLEGKTPQEIGKALAIHPTTITRYLTRNEIATNRKRPLITPEARKEIVNLAVAGLSTRDIAKKYNVTTSCICRIIQKKVMKTPIAERHRVFHKSPKRIKRADWPEILRLHETGLNKKQVANLYKVSPTRIGPDCY